MINLCDKLNFADEVFLDTVPTWLTKEAIASALSTLRKYPRVRTIFNYFGTLGGLEKRKDRVLRKLFGFNFILINAILKEINSLINSCKGQFNDNIMAIAFLLEVDSFQFGGIILNEKQLNPQSILDDLENEVKMGYSPKECDSIKALVDHEMGHLLDFDLTISGSEEYKEFINNYSVDFIEKNLSSYSVLGGIKNDREIIAESYAEYCNNPIPRIIAAEIGLLLDRHYKKRYY